MDSFKLINKDKDESIHLEKFVEVPKDWKNEILFERWEKLKKIRDFSNISIESKRAEKVIGSSLEANIKIKLKEDLYALAKNFDFGELCITSGADVILDNNLEEEISVETEKADGKKCSICWKIRKDKCERHSCNF